MASTDAKAFPIKNQAYRATFPIMDADGDLVVGATALDSEVSKDGGTFADCTNEATQIATSSGVYFLDLTATEMNADTVAIIVKTTSTGAKTTTLVFYPLEDADIRVNVAQWAGSATATGNVALKNTLAKTTDITGFNDISTANVQTELTTYGALKPTTAGRTLDVSTGGEAGLDWANIGTPATVVNLSGTSQATVTSVTNPVTLTSAYDAAKVAAPVGAAMTLTSAYDAAKTAAAPGAAMALTSGERTSVAGVIWNTLTSALTTVGSIGKLLVDNIDAKISSITGGGGGSDPWLTNLPGSYASGTAGNILGTRLDVAVSSRATPGDAMTLTSAYNASKTAAQVGDAMNLTAAYNAAKTASTQSSVDTVASYVDTEVAAIKSKTDQLNFTAGDVVATLAGETVTVSTNQDKSGYGLIPAYDAAKTASSQTSVDAVKSVVDAIKVLEDHLATAMELDGAVYRFTTNALEQSPAAGADTNAIADAVLKRDWTGVSGEAAYSLLNACRMLRNVWNTAGGTLTVKKEDGTTTAWSRPLSVDPAAQPIVGAS